MRSAQLIVGTSAPGDAAVMMLDPQTEPEAKWEKEFRAGLVRVMGGTDERESTCDPYRPLSGGVTHP